MMRPRNIRGRIRTEKPVRLWDGIFFLVMQSVKET
jgi:hypothetical protein